MTKFLIALFMTLPVGNPCSVPKATEPVPGFLEDGKTHDAGPCGWNGDYVDGVCKVRIVFSTGYPPVSCKVRKALPEEGRLNEGQIVECVWSAK